MPKRKTIVTRVPKDVIEPLRLKFPGVTDGDLLRMTYNTSILRAEIDLEKIDFKNNVGRFLYGKDAWDKMYGIKKKK